MKLHFGHGVFFFATLFVGFILYLVIQMISQPIDLVEQNYYEKGLDYQTVINHKKNEVASFKTKQELETFKIESISDLTAKSCFVKFYRPSDSQLDTSFIVPLNEGSGTASLKKLSKGLWRYTLSYQKGGEWYFQQEDLYWQ